MKEIKTVPGFPRLIGYRGLDGYFDDFESIAESSRHGMEAVKAIQIYLKNEPYLILHQFIDHAKSLDRLLQELEIQHETTNNGHATLSGDDYFVSGMGYVHISRFNRIIFSLESQTYGIGPDQDHLTDISPYFPDLSLEIKGLSL